MQDFTPPLSTPGVLNDDSGHPSSMRVMSMLAVCASILFGGITVLHQGAAATTNGVYITGLFLLMGFCPKTVQKYIELRYAQQDKASS